jgi:hypothetical protein
MVVKTLDLAMKELGGALGLEWAQPVRRTGPIHTTAGLQHRDMVLTYSKGTGHHLELVEYIDDHAYTFMSSPANHVGFWVEDLEASIAALEALGMPSEAAGAGPDGERREFSYHKNPHSDVWIEIVDSAGRPGLERWTDPNN